MSRFGDAVLLKRAVNRVSRQNSSGAQWFVGSLAERARETGTVQPFYADMIADFDLADKFAALDYDASTLVAPDKGRFGFERPVSI